MSASKSGVTDTNSNLPTLEKEENIFTMLHNESNKIRKIEKVSRNIKDREVKSVNDLFERRQTLNILNREVSGLGSCELKNRLLDWLKSEEDTLAGIEKVVSKTFSSALSRSFEQQSIPLKGVMPRLEAGFYTLIFKLDLNRCEVFYGPKEEKIVSLPLDPDRIAEEVKKHREKLLSGYTDLSLFFMHLEEAFKRASQNSNRTMGNQIPLIDVLLEMSYIYQGKEFREDPIAANFKSYNRVQFSFDLYRINQIRDKPITIRLFTANRIAVKDRMKYLWIPREENVENGAQYSYIEVTTAK